MRDGTKPKFENKKNKWLYKNALAYPLSKIKLWRSHRRCRNIMNGIVNFSWANALLSQPNENAEKERRNSAMPCICNEWIFFLLSFQRNQKREPHRHAIDWCYTLERNCTSIAVAVSGKLTQDERCKVNHMFSIVMITKWQWQHVKGMRF